MSYTFGDFIEEGTGIEFLKLNFSPFSISLKQRWHNNGLSADFLADYWSTFFHTEEKNSIVSKSEEVKNAVGYIANELLENAMKFSYAPAGQPVSIGLHLDENRMRFYVTNSINPQTVTEFQQFIQRLLTEDPDDLYIAQLEKNAEADDEDEGSHLGFLTMLNDYDAILAWKFEKIQYNPDITILTTMVKLNV